VVEIAHDRGVPVIVDAAAEVPPAGNLRALKATGADVVVISGGKGLRGPQNSAMVLCSEELADHCILHAAPMHSHGRSMKTTKEDMVGLVKAVEIYTGLDHEALTVEWQRQAQQVVEAVAGIAGVQAETAEAGYSEGIPVARVTVGRASGGGAGEVAAALKGGDPSVRVGEEGETLVVNPHFLYDGEVELVIERLVAALKGVG
jgi:seryl-tRNA(Sec) selenium transferase